MLKKKKKQNMKKKDYENNLQHYDNFYIVTKLKDYENKSSQSNDDKIKRLCNKNIIKTTFIFLRQLLYNYDERVF